MASAGFLVTQNFVISAVILAAASVFIVAQLVSDWWRRLFVFTIIAMGAGSSHIGWAVQIGGIAKLAGLVLLALVTMLTTRSVTAKWAGKTHKLAIAILWLTFALASLSIVWSHSRLETATQAVAFLAFVYILHRSSTTRWTDKHTLIGDIGTAYWAAFALLLAGAVLALVGFPDAISEYSGRHQGIFGNPNRLGLIAAVSVGLGLGWAIHKRNAVVWVSILIPLSQVILSQSRTSIIAVTIAMLWVVFRSGLKNVIVVSYLSVTSLLVALAFSWRPLEGYFERFSATDGGDVLNSRTLAWRDVQQSLSENPLGVGWAASQSTLEQWSLGGMASGLNSVHNSYLQMIFELGLIGIIPVALILGLLVRVSTMKQTGLGIGLGAVALTGTLVQITESAIFGLGQPYPYLFWLAVIAATVYQPEPSRDRDSGTEVAVKRRRIVART